MDKDYHRSVVTIIGEIDVVVSMVESAKIASNKIDLNVQGEHPYGSSRCNSYFTN